MTGSSHAADTMAAGAACAIRPSSIWWRAKRRTASPIWSAMARPSTATRDGTLALGREAAHSRARIVHVKGDRAGAEISAHPGGARR